MKTLVLLFGVFASISLRADVAIFSVTSTNRLIGVGQTATILGNGRVVVDVETLTRVGIGWFTLNGQKYFSINRTAHYIRTVIAAGGVAHTVVGYADMGFDQNGWYHVREGYARGKNAQVPIRPTRSVSLPLTLNSTGRNIQEGPNGNVATEENGVISFMVLQTQKANAAGETVEAAIARFANGLRAQGYTEVIVPE